MKCILVMNRPGAGPYEVSRWPQQDLKAHIEFMKGFAIHDEAKSAEATDWAQILGLYALLGRMSDNPMVTLNHAIATAMVHGPAAGASSASTPSPKTRASRIITAWTRSARTFSSGAVTRTARSSTTGARRSARRACQSRTTSSCTPHG